MSMILYHGEPNGPSLTALAMVGETGLDVDCRPIALLRGERHTIPGLTEPLARDMGLEGEGPVLVVDGEAMTESVFLAQYMDEMAGNALQPKDAYAHWQMMMWCRRITERCAPAAAFLGNKAFASPVLAAMADAEFDAAIAPIVSGDLKQRWIETRADSMTEAAVGNAMADSTTKLTAAVQMVEDQLADGREWLMGDVSIADIETYGWLAGAEALVPGVWDNRPRAAAWAARVRSRPSVAAALARATVAQPETAWAPGPEINRWG
ncbi:glutathione S-transferase family protein [Novosphingobium sp. FSY-8]|uniref:Glutathione S-transferase family protein n=1 Tax=Novosphingobium ovatum TaxID=1908523 RepID=A0ABW9XDE9_9SPHN|nr:glutathione binding-like protein [Novosphingobium ovatum]NBC36559.1 glutathione S-transferase family protein [Novosphingobium ovatum]